MSTNVFIEVKRASGTDLYDFHSPSLSSYFSVLRNYDARRLLWPNNSKNTRSAQQWPFRHIPPWIFIYYTLSPFDLLCMKSCILDKQQDLLFNSLRVVSNAIIKPSIYKGKISISRENRNFSPGRPQNLSILTAANMPSEKPSAQVIFQSEWGRQNLDPHTRILRY